jgi:hypothetical protein
MSINQKFELHWINCRKLHCTIVIYKDNFIGHKPPGLKFSWVVLILGIVEKRSISNGKDPILDELVMPLFSLLLN